MSGNSDSHDPSSDVTAWLAAANQGDRPARERLFEIVERELRLIAAKQMRRERPDHSLQVTLLVDETLMQLLGDKADVLWENRRHFYRAAARKMRNLLIDHERRRRAQRRGGAEQARVAVDPDQLGSESSEVDLLALNEALNKLATVDLRQSEIVELHHFGGCTLAETAKILDVSATTAKNEWRLAKAWLHRELTRGTD